MIKKLLLLALFFMGVQSTVHSAQNSWLNQAFRAAAQSGRPGANPAPTNNPLIPLQQALKTLNGNVSTLQSNLNDLGQKMLRSLALKALEQEQDQTGTQRQQGKTGMQQQAQISAFRKADQPTESWSNWFNRKKTELAIGATALGIATTAWLAGSSPWSSETEETKGLQKKQHGQADFYLREDITQSYPTAYVFTPDSSQMQAHQPISETLETQHITGIKAREIGRTQSLKNLLSNYKHDKKDKKTREELKRMGVRTKLTSKELQENIAALSDIEAKLAASRSKNEINQAAAERKNIYQSLLTEEAQSSAVQDKLQAKESEEKSADLRQETVINQIKSVEASFLSAKQTLLSQAANAAKESSAEKQRQEQELADAFMKAAEAADERTRKEAEQEIAQIQEKIKAREQAETTLQSRFDKAIESLSADFKQELNKIRAEREQDQAELTKAQRRAAGDDVDEQVAD